ncbi:MAG: hypothetical protein R3C15_00600 [Thermoleophilia bacterium]
MAVLGTADCDLQAIMASVRRLAELDFDALLPGHRDVVLDGGKAHVEQARATIDLAHRPAQLFA